MTGVSVTRRALAVAGLTAALALAGCASTGDDEHDGALAAVEAYVMAIEDGDLETATAMTDPVALEPPPEVTSSPVDITASLPQVVDPMHDTWIAFEGVDFTWLDDGSSESTDVVRFRVSFIVGESVGSASVAMMLTGDDADDAGSWTVTDGLLSTTPVYADDDTIAGFTIGGSDEIVPDDSGAQQVWGYPGVYLQEATSYVSGQSADAAAEPVEAHIGVDAEHRWDEPLPRLEVAP